jgi:hypothetical protein
MKKMKELQALINCNKVNSRTLQLTTNNYTITIIGVENAYYVMIENIQGIVFSDFAETVEEVYSLIEATEYNCMNELIDNDFNSFIN